jgi:hypothetical protein
VTVPGAWKLRQGVPMKMQVSVMGTYYVHPNNSFEEILVACSDDLLDTTVGATSQMRI